MTLVDAAAAAAAGVCGRAIHSGSRSTPFGIHVGASAGVTQKEELHKHICFLLLHVR